MDPVFIIAAAAVVGVTGLAVSVRAWEIWRSREHWRAMADALGLELSATGSIFKHWNMTGEIDGLSIDVQTIHRGGAEDRRLFTVINAHPSIPPPAGLRLEREALETRLITMLGGQDIPLRDPLADEKLRVRGQHPTAVQAVLDHPTARPILVAVMEGKARTRFDDNKLTIETSGDAVEELEALVRTAVGGVQALDQAARAPWVALAETHGLRYEEASGAATLDGDIHGLPLLVRAQYSRDHSRTRIQVTLRGGLPNGVRIRTGASGLRIGDPLLDGRAGIESLTRDTTHNDAAIRRPQRRLRDPGQDLRGCLMDVLQGMPGATVEGGTVRRDMPHRAGPELADSIDRMVALGQALSDTLHR